MESSISSGLIPTDTPIPVQVLNRKNNKTNGCKVKSILYLSVTEIVIGLLCIIFNAVLMSSGERCNICEFSYGYIAGILYCTSGVLGCCFFKFQANKCLSIAFMVMNIISASCSSYPVSLGIIEFMIDFGYGRRPITRLGLAIAVFSFIEFTIAIICSAISCKLLCTCCRNEDDTPTYAFYDTKTQQFVLIAGNKASLPSPSSSSLSRPSDMEAVMTSIQSNEVIDNESFKYKPFK